MSIYPTFPGGAEYETECMREFSDPVCILEKQTVCAIEAAQRAGPQSDLNPGQTQFVPWLSCLDGSEDVSAHTADPDGCSQQVQLDMAAYSDCMEDDDGLAQKVQNYVDAAPETITGVLVNGRNLSPDVLQFPSYEDVVAAICQADPSLSGCSADIAGIVA